MKKLIWASLLLISVLILLCGTAMAASSGTCGTGVNWSLDDNGRLTISGSGKMNNYNWKSVYVNGTNIFVTTAPWGSSVSEVSIGSGITHIGNYAFYGCFELTNVNLSQGLSTIGTAAFFTCLKLSDILIPNTVTSIGADAFRGCRSLNSIIIPKSVIYLGTNCFGNCTSLTSLVVENGNNKYVSYDNVLYNKDMTTLYSYRSSQTIYHIPTTVTTIASMAFSACNWLTHIEIPNGVTSIGSYAFSNCSNLENVIIPNGITNIGDHAFYNCISLSNATIPNSVISIEKFTFYGCSSLTNVMISDGVTRIGDSAFYDCVSLSSISIPNSVISIENFAFNGCSNLSSIVIPSNVSSIGLFAFRYCNSLTSVIFLTKSVAIDGRNAFPINNTDITFTVLPGSSAYDFAVTNNVPYNLYSSPTVSDYLYYGSTDGAIIIDYTGNKSTIIVPDSINGYPVVGIGRCVFSNCTNLTSITIPNSIVSVNSSAFSGLTNLVTINYHNSIMTLEGVERCGQSGRVQWIIGNNKRIYFFGTEKMQDYTLDSTLPWKTAGCTDAVFLDGITNIGNYTFYNCSGLISVTIPNSVTSIGSSAFSSCTSLINVTIPNSVTSIGSSAFNNCSNLTSITFPDSVAFIGSYAFSNCSKLNEVNYQGNKLFLNGIDSQGITGSLYYLVGKNKTLLLIGQGEIGSYTFKEPAPWQSYSGADYWQSAPITSVYISDGVTSIGDYAFYDCTKVPTITIPDSVTSVGYSAFSSSIVLYANSNSDASKALSKRGYDFRESDENYSIRYLLSGDEITGIELARVDKSVEVFSIPNNIISIGNSAFKNCSNLTDITIPNSVTNIKGSAFYGCSKLENVIIPDSVIIIERESFYGCTSLTNIVIPDSVISINDSTFYRCTSLISVTIPGSVRSISSSAFIDCFSITEIHIDSIESWLSPTNFSRWSSQYCLYINNEILNSVVIPDVFTTVRYSAFNNCIGLTSVIIPDGVTSIGSYAFEGCSSLTSVIMSNSVISIGYAAFQGCSSLCTVTIPDSVTSVEYYAFTNCEQLTSVVILSQNTVFSDPVFDAEPEGLTLTVLPDSTALEYAIEKGISYVFYSGEMMDFVYSTNNDETITIIGYNGTETHVTIPATINDYPVVRIGTNAFKNAKEIISIELPDSIVNIGENAFNGCTELASIGIPNNVKNIGPYAFANSGLVTLSIPSRITTICENTFCNCPNLESILIPSSVTSIEKSAFENCSSLVNIEIPASVKTLSDNVFNNCSSLETITFSGSMPSITENTFIGCKSVNSIICSNGTIHPSQSTLYGTCGNNALYSLENGILYIVGTGNIWGYSGTYSNGSFYIIPKPDTPWYGKSITQIIVRDGITGIGSRAFSTLSSVTSASLPSTISFIGLEAFERCGNLTQITIPESVTTIAESAFDNCRNLSCITFLGDAPSISESSFGYVNSNVYYTPTSSWKNKTLNYGGTLTWIKPNDNCGTDSFWILDDITVLRLRGPGKVNKATWTQYADTVTTLVLASDVGGIAENLLSTMPNLTSVIFEGDIPSMDPSAFAGISATVFYSHCFSSFTETALQNYGGNISWQLYCQHNGKTIIPFEAIHYDEVQPTDCITYGHTAHWKCSSCGLAFGDDSLTRRLNNEDWMIPPREHEWSTEVTYIWADDYATVTASRSCIHDATHIDSETVSTTKIVTASPSDTDLGTFDYVSDTFINNAFTVQRTEGGTIPALGTLDILYLPAGLITIEDEAFAGLNCQAIIIPNGCTTIGHNAFADCTNLVYVFIPGSVTTIEADTFTDCPNVIIDRASE